ncbi:hypothetical protein U0070_010102 [Myodes glareolus]|uniref:Uncharacterized protein n=1 Tax=Myodes glareolus TaxID=447135 RepID=A0AAW0I335_MYOGA
MVTQLDRLCSPELYLEATFLKKHSQSWLHAPSPTVRKMKSVMELCVYRAPNTTTSSSWCFTCLAATVRRGGGLGSFYGGPLRAQQELKGIVYAKLVETLCTKRQNTQMKFDDSKRLGEWLSCPLLAYTSHLLLFHSGLGLRLFLLTEPLSCHLQQHVEHEQTPFWKMKDNLSGSDN